MGNAVSDNRPVSWKNRDDDGSPPHFANYITVSEGKFSSLRERYPGECFLLESLEGPQKVARYSFIGVDPISCFKSRDGIVEIDGEPHQAENPYEALRSHFRSFSCGASDIVPFSGGMVGYVGYGMVRHFEDIPEKKTVDAVVPDLYFVLPKHLVCVDHLHSRTFLISHGKTSDLSDALADARPAEPEELVVGEGRSDTDKEAFEKMVLDAKEHILEGDIFQVVLSRSTQFPVRGDSLGMYSILRSLNPSPYLFYLDFNRVHILGSSPEMLVRLEGTRLTTRPLAGTRKRSADVEEDEKLKIEMLLDEKSVFIPCSIIKVLHLKKITTSISAMKEVSLKDSISWRKSIENIMATNPIISLLHPVPLISLPG